MSHAFQLLTCLCLLASGMPIVSGKGGGGVGSGGHGGLTPHQIKGAGGRKFAERLVTSSTLRNLAVVTSFKCSSRDWVIRGCVDAKTVAFCVADQWVTLKCNVRPPLSFCNPHLTGFNVLGHPRKAYCVAKPVKITKKVVL